MTLCVRTDVPFGNACDIATRSTAAGDLVEFTPDPRGGTEAMWFCFRVERADGAAPRPLKLVLKHVGTMLAGLMPGVIESIRPVVRDDGGEWRRLGVAEAVVLPDGRRWASWTVVPTGSAIDVALCYPYGPEELEALVRDMGGYWRSDVIGVSQGGRPIHRLRNRCSDDPQREPGLYLVGRQHAGETPGSWVLDGLMHRMAEHGDRAPRVWCVPLADIDGVVRGDYGKDAFPHDLNRAWGNPPMRHETLVISRDMHLWASRCTPRLVLDFHAPGIGEREGMYVFASPHDEPGRMHPQAGPWVDALARAAGALGSPRFCRKPTHAGRWRGELDLSGFSAATFDVPTLVLECSYALAGESVLTVTGYQSLGTRLADALIAHLDRSI